ncbi:MAG: polyprenol monophosphomannose synthase [Bacteroidetes bacterium]|nr:polyprenol monophosphomannose synthase [Bacteroidota bacterium]GDX47863.1 dolichol-phosphate mannosyltransferase [Bacteroidota bacterium]
MKNSIIIIPTYNEIENAPRIIRTIFQLYEDAHILIIDDGSPDGTAEEVKKMINDFSSKLFIIERKGKLGLGTAYITGFKWALEKKYDYIIEMDADYSHPPEKLIELYNACSSGGADVAVGSRYTNGGKVVNWPVGRILMSYFASLYVRMITFMPVRDTTAGFVCYKRKVLENLNLDTIEFVGYAFQIEMKYAAWKKKFIIREVPITFTDRKEGESKMSKGIFKEAVLGVLKMRTKGYK